MKKENLYNLKGNNGITLVALVITIIVLLILAGVSISALTGETSIIGNAKTSVSAYNNKVEQSDTKINNLEQKLNNIIKEMQDTPSGGEQVQPGEPVVPGNPSEPGEEGVPQQETFLVNEERSFSVTNAGHFEEFTYTVPEGVNVLKFSLSGICQAGDVHSEAIAIRNKETQKWYMNTVAVGPDYDWDFCVNVTEGKTYTIELYAVTQNTGCAFDVDLKVSYSASINETQTNINDL